ncbi:MAG: class I SAM-dependent methyltransferase [Pirellulales bacterium]|nr:class I SAM-dependent methyltransferase [Pirellulales bacterium]
MKLGDFTENAAIYEDARPSYPDRLVQDLIADAGVKSGSSIAEIGAGTGKFTRMLVQRGLRVTALEPSAAMRDAAPQMKNVTWTDGTFTQTRLPGESQDWIVAAQSFHWANPKTDLPELRRVLRSDCRLTIFWNDRLNDRHPVLRRAVEIISEIVPNFDEAYRQLNWSEILTSSGDFSDVIVRTQEHVFPMSSTQFLNYWRSHNRFTVTAGEERREQVLRELKAYLDSLSETELGQNENIAVVGQGMDSQREQSERGNAVKLHLPLICQSWSAKRT